MFQRETTPNCLARLVAATGLIALAAVALGVSCATPGEATAPAHVAPPAATPTPTAPPAVDPGALVSQASESTLAMQSMRFSITHESGGIYIPVAAVRATTMAGVWDRERGATLSIDSHLVGGPDSSPEHWTPIVMDMVVSPEGYFVTDPVSGVWMKRPDEELPVPIASMNQALSDMILLTESPRIAGQELLDGVEAYRVDGQAPASVMGWMMLVAEEERYVDISLWIESEQKRFRKIRVAGPIDHFDAPDTVRVIFMSDINRAVDIVVPEEFIDLTQF